MQEHEARELHVAFTFRGLVTGWQCSICRQEFHIPLERATDILLAPQDVQHQFDQHHCLQTLAQVQSSS
jgi:hypothetical protein